MRGALLACSLMAALAAQPVLPPAPGRLVDIGNGRKLHLLCGGQGSPAVVFEAGASSFAIDFTNVQRELEKSHRVCSYDRAGSGWSDPLPPDALAADPSDLHALLTAAREAPPYVLVGASRGGLLVRAYLAAYPDDVAEMTAEQMRSTLPGRPVRIPRRPVQRGAPFDSLPPELYQQRLLLDERLVAAQPETLTPEQVGRYTEHERAFLASLLASRKAGTPFGSRPTIVLSRGDQRHKDREDAHKALANLSTNSRHNVIDGAGHEIHLFHPRAIVNAVNDVSEAVVKRSQLRGQ